MDTKIWMEFTSGDIGNIPTSSGVQNIENWIEFTRDDVGNFWPILTELPSFAIADFFTDDVSSEYLASVKKSAVSLRFPGF